MVKMGGSSPQLDGCDNVHQNDEGQNFKRDHGMPHLELQTISMRWLFRRRFFLSAQAWWVASLSLVCT
jgi:hypothetical protein